MFIRLTILTIMRAIEPQITILLVTISIRRTYKKNEVIAV